MQSLFAHGGSRRTDRMLDFSLDRMEVRMVVSKQTASGFAGRASALGGWLLVIAGFGALSWLIIATRTRPEAELAESERPFAQVSRRHNDAPVCSLAFTCGTSRMAWGT